MLAEIFAAGNKFLKTAAKVRIFSTFVAVLCENLQDLTPLVTNPCSLSQMFCSLGNYAYLRSVK